MNNAIDPGQNLCLTRWLEFTLAAFYTNSSTRLNLMHLSEVYKETWTPQKDDTLYYKKETLNIDKCAVGIYKEDRLVGHGFMTGDSMDCMSRGNLWPRQNYFTKVNVMRVRNLFLWQAMGGSTISCHNGFSLHRKTATAQQDPERLIDKLNLYVLHACRLSIKYKYPPSSIITMDETSTSNGMVSNTTIHKQGVKPVCLKRTENEKFIVSTCLTAKADGTKLKTFVVFRAAKIKSKS